MKKIFKLVPHLEKRIWGSNNLEKYNIDLKQQNNIGEAWLISAYSNKSSIIVNGKYKNKTLEWLFDNKKKWFDNYEGITYPLLVKLLDCNDKLSIKVHPNDEYAMINYNSLGKNECWYFLDAIKDYSIILGHNANSKEEFNNLVKQEKWDKLLKTKKIKTDDFIYIPSGTIHSLNAGSIVYELQQSSDLTFRLFDYNRKEQDKKRKLHLTECIKNIVFPYKPCTKKEINSHDDFLIDNNSFSLVKIVNTKYSVYKFPEARWLQVSIISGKGCIYNKQINKGDNFLILKTKKIELVGNVTVFVSYIKK